MANAEEGETPLLFPEQPDSAIQEQLDGSCGAKEWNEEATCQVELIRSGRGRGRGSHTSDQPWRLHALDQNGQRKIRGGDEFYVRYEEFIVVDSTDENPCGAETDAEETILVFQAVALVSDSNDGSYTLDFCTTPMHPDLPPESSGRDYERRATLAIYFEYTNGIGRLPSPTKKDWPTGGYTHRRFTKTVHQDTHLRPPTRAFSPPVCPIDMGNFVKVFCYGDSTMDQFVRQRLNKKGKYHFQPNLHVGEKVRQGLNSQTLGNMLALLEDEFGAELRESSSATEGSTCLVLGSCLWDILDASDSVQGDNYQDHLQACRDYIEQVRQRFPNVTVVWKSPMAVHIHWVDLERLIEQDRAAATLFGVDRVRYMSASRSRYLYEIQDKLMKELQVPVLDLYEATYLSADQLYPSDGRHYRPDLNRKMLGWFFPKANNDQRYYQNER